MYDNHIHLIDLAMLINAYCQKKMKYTSFLDDYFTSNMVKLTDT